MNVSFEKKIQQVERGKTLFKKIFNLSELNKNDSFLLVLTDNEKCIYFGEKYLIDFINFYHKRNVYVLLENARYAEGFSKSGGCVRVCNYKEIQSLAIYLNIFHRKDGFDSRIIFLTEKDGWGFPVEELLSKGEFTLEEYVVVSLFQLKK